MSKSRWSENENGPTLVWFCWLEFWKHVFFGKKMPEQTLILNAEKRILVEQWFWKPINRRHALGGGWGGGGPNPSLPPNVVPQCTTCITLNQDLVHQTEPSCTNVSPKISWKSCKLEVGRVFGNTRKVCSSKTPKWPCKKSHRRKWASPKLSWKNAS